MSDAPLSLAAQVRAQDHERYLLTLLQPAAVQPHLWALLAFASEIARVPEVVSQEMVGLIRLAWWKERIADTYAGAEPYPHEVVRGLHTWIAAAPPPRVWLEALVEARQEQVGRTDIVSMKAFEAFARGTAGQLAALMSFACRGDVALAERAVPIGTAYGMLGLVRSAPVALARGELLLPRLSVAHGLSPDALREASHDVVRQVRERALLLLQEVPEDGITPLLAWLAKAWEARIRAAGDDMFSFKLQESLPFLALRLTMARILRKS